MLKYELKDVYRKNRIFANGNQVLVRIMLERKRLDMVMKLNTAGFVSGYRGSPLGGVDVEMKRASSQLREHEIHFEYGLNEDLAATSCWGTQLVSLSNEYGFDSTHDGVFSMWYGKGPGVDRSIDALKHANLVGTSRYGGVLAVFGDDHACKSSTLPHQSEQSMIAASIPVLHPCSLSEVLQYGVLGIEMSRYSGCWIGLKTTSDNMDSAESIDLSSPQLHFPPKPVRENVHARSGEFKLVEAERRLHEIKLPLVQDFWRENGNDGVIFGSSGSETIRLGIVGVGKTCVDVRKALKRLGLESGNDATRKGISIFKVGMSYPLEPKHIGAWASDCEKILIVEEKRSLVELQLKNVMYSHKSNTEILGKCDEHGASLLSEFGQLNASSIASAIQRVFPQLSETKSAIATTIKDTDNVPQRTPFFCAGCPHNLSTKLPTNTVAMAGIGCHTLAMNLERSKTMMYTHMGAEGAHWIGMNHFVRSKKKEDPHVFINLGDGTYTHSGLLSIRQAVSSERNAVKEGRAVPNMTFKILCNNAVAMTGGQTPEGSYDALTIARQIKHEGIDQVHIVSANHVKLKSENGIHIHPRDRLMKVQDQLRDVSGVSALIYEQTCAAELRRGRRRGTEKTPKSRIFINSRICEGCGDCQVKSNCVAIVPVDTKFGRKRAIDQSVCNMDFSCLHAFCPAVIRVDNADPKVSSISTSSSEQLPPPLLREITNGPYRILITGIGGSGVVSCSQILGMAAFLENRQVAVLDEIGLSQKNGGVVSQVNITDEKNDDVLISSKIDDAETNLLLGLDIMTSCTSENLARLCHDTNVVINTAQVMPGHFSSNPDYEFPDLRNKIYSRVTSQKSVRVESDLNELSRQFMGDSVFANIISLGIALQSGLLPISLESLERAIELNGVAIHLNKKALELGRRVALAKEKSLVLKREEHISTEDLISEFTNELDAWSGSKNSKASRSLRDVLSKFTSPKLRRVVCENYFKLLAFKDEYEVARLHLATTRLDLENHFSSSNSYSYSLGHEMIPTTNEKFTLSSNLGDVVFKVLSRVRHIRGSWMDPFRFLSKNRLHVSLLSEYEETLDFAVNVINEEEVDEKVLADLLNYPSRIRGFGHVRERNAKLASEERRSLLSKLRH